MPHIKDPVIKKGIPPGDTPTGEVGGYLRNEYKNLKYIDSHGDTYHWPKDNITNYGN